MSKFSAAEDKPYHHGDLRNACVKAALGLARDFGLEGLTLRGVAQKIGVSRTAPYRHFASKRDLLAASAAEGFRSLEREVDLARDAAGEDPIKRLHAGCSAYADFGARSPCLYRLMFGSDFNQDEYPELDEAGGSAFASLVEGLEKGQQAGLIKRADTADQALAVWAALHGVMNLYIDSKPSRVLDTSAVQDNVRRVLATILTGLAAESSADQGSANSAA